MSKIEGSNGTFFALNVYELSDDSIQKLIFYLNRTILVVVIQDPDGEIENSGKTFQFEIQKILIFDQSFRAFIFDIHKEELENDLARLMDSFDAEN